MASKSGGGVKVMVVKSYAPPMDQCLRAGWREYPAALAVSRSRSLSKVQYHMRSRLGLRGGDALRAVTACAVCFAARGLDVFLSCTCVASTSRPKSPAWRITEMTCRSIPSASGIDLALPAEDAFKSRARGRSLLVCSLLFLGAACIAQVPQILHLAAFIMFVTTNNEQIAQHVFVLFVVVVCFILLVVCCLM